MPRDKDVFQQPSAGTVTHDEPPPGARGASTRTFFGQPVGLSTLFFTEMWERFSFYGIRPLLILFMTAALASGGFNFSRETAGAAAKGAAAGAAAGAAIGAAAGLVREKSSASHDDSDE